MDLVRDQFVPAARMAEAAGFDMLELHMAHGYLLASFISPLTNLRTRRVRRRRSSAHALSARGARRRAGRLAGGEAHLGQDLRDRLGAGRHDRRRRGPRSRRCSGRTAATSSTVSTGQTVADQQPVYGRLYQTPFSDRIRHEAGIPTMTVGNLSTYADANSILAAGRADLCALARGHLYDPYWTRHAAREQGYDLPWPNQYVSVKSYSPRQR